MKYSIALLFTTIAWFSTCVFAQTYKPPADKVIKEKLNLTMPQFIEKCQKHPGLIKVETEDRSIATERANNISDKIVKEVKKSGESSEKTWKQLIKDHCLENVVIKTSNASNVDDINKCLDEEDKLKGQKKTEFEHALIKAYCAEVERMAKEKYAADKN